MYLAASTALLATGCAGKTASAAGDGTSADVNSNYVAAVQYTGGTAGAANQKLTPITIGWVNEQGGSSSTPEATAGVTAAIDLINNKLGGIDGHRLVVDSCFVQDSAEQGQACAQQMYNDQAVHIVLSGATSLAAESLHSILGTTKPVLGSTPSGPSDLSATNAYYLGSGAFGTAADVTYAVNYLHAKKIAVVAPAFPGTTVAMQQIDAAAKKLGVTVTLGSYTLGSANVTPAVVASGARTSDAILALDPSSTGCIAISRALTTEAVTTHVVSNASCATEDVANGLGGSLPKWTYTQPTYIPSLSVTGASTTEKSETAVFLAAMKTYQPQSTVFGLAGSSFAQVLYLARVMTELGADNLSSAQISAALSKSTGPVFMASPTLKFGTASATAIGSFKALFYTFDGDGKWTNATGGVWIS